MEVLLGLSIVGLLLVVTIVLPVLGFLRASRALGEVKALRARLAALEEHLREIAAWQGRAEGYERRQPDASGSQPVPVILPEPPADTPGPSPVDSVVPPGKGSQPSSGPLESGVSSPPPPVPAPAGGSPPPSLHARTPAAPPEMAARPGARLLADPPAAARRADGPGKEGLEEAIGGRLLLYVGVLVLVLGMAFFLKYAFEREWITEWMRVLLGGAAGAALVAGGLRFASAGYPLYGQILSGGGLAILYLSVYAAFSFYELISSTVAFTLLVLITMGAAVLADRQRSQGMAVMAVGGGFLAPFLVGGGTDAQAVLFSYDAILVAGTMYLARRRQWPLLNLVSYVLTVLTVAAWAVEYYTRAKYLRTELFLTLFCAMFLGILVQTRRSASGMAVAAATVLWTAPVLYHGASLLVLEPHGAAFLVYLIAFTVVGVGWAMRSTPALHVTATSADGWALRAIARVLLWLAVILPLLGWIESHPARAWIAPALVTLAAVFALHLVAQLDRVFRQEARLDAIDVLLVHLNGLGTFLGVYLLLEPHVLAWVTGIGIGLALLHAAMAAWLRTRDGAAAFHALAVAFTLTAATVAVELDGAWLTAAWAAEGAAVVWIALRVGEGWLRTGGALLLAAAAGRWLVLSVPTTPAHFRLVSNEAFLLGTWIVGLLYLLAWRHRRHAEEPGTHRRSVATLLVAASALTVVLLSGQNASYWNLQGSTSADATFAEGLALSLIWAFYAALLIVVGIRRDYAPIRYAAMVLFGLTIAKVFLVDLSGLEGIYRVLGLLAVGTVLLVVSFLYQRRRQKR